MAYKLEYVSGRSHACTHLKPYFDGDVGFGFTFYTQLPQEIPAWLSVYYTFHLRAWIAVLCSLLAVALALKLMHEQDLQWHQIINYILSTMMAQDSVVTIGSLKSCFIIASWVAGGTFISFFFLSSLIASLTRPAYKKVPNTWQDLIDMNYTVVTEVFRNDAFSWVPATHIGQFIQVCIE